MPDWQKRHPVTEACAIADNFISTIKGHYESIQVKLNSLFNNKIKYVFILF
jgi:hypothetical protein